MKTAILFYIRLFSAFAIELGAGRIFAYDTPLLIYWYNRSEICVIKHQIN
jgi:hypothetical protein